METMDSIELTEELRLALAARPGEPLRLIDRHTKASTIVLRSEDFYRIQAALEEKEDEAAQKAWLEMAAKTRRAWVQERADCEPV